MNLNYFYFRLMKKILSHKPVKHTVYGGKILDIQKGGDLIASYLQKTDPCMIARIGSVEMQAINAVYTKECGLCNCIPEVYLKMLSNNAGFFPSTEDALLQFVKCYEQSAKQLDCAGMLRNRDEDYFYKYKTDHKIEVMDLCALEPYYSDHPWTTALKGMRVLVINPFVKTIEMQYARRKKLFSNFEILPEFTLYTIKAIQTIGNNTGGFQDWFEALECMKKQMREIDFDIALIGCGAYSFPLAAYAKELGKKSVVVGGALQVLFGIRGKRWEQIPEVSQLYNEYWVRPSDEERPVGAENVESGCYW